MVREAARLALDFRSGKFRSIPHSPLAKSYGDALLVAAPSPDKMMFVRAHNSDAAKALSAVAAASMKGEFKPISAEVFRWTEKGWVLASL